MKFVRSAAIAAMLLSATPALAFDDYRQGFILSLGAGFHSITNDYKYNDYSYLTESTSGLATSFKIGGGITDQFALYFVRNVSWFSSPVSDGIRTWDATAAVGISGIGATYYFEPTAPSGYMLAAIGGADFSFPFESNVSNSTGGAFMLGGGYEFDRHLMIEATLLATSVTNPTNSYNKMDSAALQVTLNYMFY